VNTARIYGILSGLYTASRVDDNSCPSVDSCYHFRILLKPLAGWPDQTVWNWDWKFVEEHGYSVWLNLFYSYLGPFHSAVIDEFKYENKNVYLRRWPATALPEVSREFAPILHVFAKEGWVYVSEQLQSIIPNLSVDARGTNRRTIFELLFSETYPVPGRWDGVWDIIDPLQSQQPVEPIDVAPTERRLGHLVTEATLRNELGLDPDFGKRKRT
jgi:hypothetical protein